MYNALDGSVKEFMHWALGLDSQVSDEFLYTELGVRPCRELALHMALNTLGRLAHAPETRVVRRVFDARLANALNVRGQRAHRSKTACGWVSAMVRVFDVVGLPRSRLVDREFGESLTAWRAEVQAYMKRYAEKRHVTALEAKTTLKHYTRVQPHPSRRIAPYLLARTDAVGRTVKMHARAGTLPIGERIVSVYESSERRTLRARNVAVIGIDPPALSGTKPGTTTALPLVDEHTINTLRTECPMCGAHSPETLDHMFHECEPTACKWLRNNVCEIVRNAHAGSTPPPFDALTNEQLTTLYLGGPLTMADVDASMSAQTAAAAARDCADNDDSDADKERQAKVAKAFAALLSTRSVKKQIDGVACAFLRRMWARRSRTAVGRAVAMTEAGRLRVVFRRGTGRRARRMCVTKHEIARARERDDLRRKQREQEQVDVFTTTLRHAGLL
jgi:hypothetical protein